MHAERRTSIRILIDAEVIYSRPEPEVRPTRVAGSRPFAPNPATKPVNRLEWAWKEHFELHGARARERAPLEGSRGRRECRYRKKDKREAT